MSYDIKLFSAPPHDNHAIMRTNWLRSPFGLCDFAEDNVGDDKKSLWHVCNDHAYSNVNELDRQEFQRVVHIYWDRIRSLTRGYFHFSFKSYMQFVSHYMSTMVPVRVMWEDSTFIWKGDDGRLGIDMEAFSGWDDFMPPFSPSGKSVLGEYKGWFKQLVAIADAMQNPDIIVDISN